jgi:orotate phosphoribosyltransferase
VVITEDTVTRGTSLLEAARVVSRLRRRVVLLFAVVDRGGTVEAMAAQEGWAFDALFGAPDLGIRVRRGSYLASTSSTRSRHATRSG